MKDVEFRIRDYEVIKYALNNLTRFKSGTAISVEANDLLKNKINPKLNELTKK